MPRPARIPDRPSWDAWALGVAVAVSARADCRRRQVGAVIVGEGHRVVSTGYNGVAPGRTGCLSGACPRGLRGYGIVPEGVPYDEEGVGFCIATHAEVNALIQAWPGSLESASIYVTCEPCVQCYKIIANTPVRRIVYPDSTGKITVKLV